ncbi:MAG: winged helix-turn-helix domain-containing protein, partial [Desulfitobacteriaceae bacterium]|nr:winged helix-turn-helix domain-containing protein [Desulfitobacteriaceae bacterium]
YLRINNQAMAAACRLRRRLWNIRPGGVGVDLEEACKDMAIIRKNKPGLLVYETSLSILGAIAREAEDFALAENSLLSAIRSAKVKKAYQVLCGSYFHLSSMYFRNGKIEKGHGYLQEAMELASQNRYFMFWDIHLPTLTGMILRSLRYGYCTGFAGELLAKLFDQDTAKYLSEKVKTLNEDDITAFVDDFLGRCKADQVQELYFVKAKLFGNPEISVNGIPIPDAEWKTKKVKGLLEYLLLNSGKTVSKEALADIFWPDVDGRSAMVSLRTALYQLRKTLAKYNVKVSGHNALFTKHLPACKLRIMMFWSWTWPNSWTLILN